MQVRRKCSRKYAWTKEQNKMTQSTKQYRYVNIKKHVKLHPFIWQSVIYYKSRLSELSKLKCNNLSYFLSLKLSKSDITPKQGYTQQTRKQKLQFYLFFIVFNARSTFVQQMALLHRYRVDTFLVSFSLFFFLKETFVLPKHSCAFSIYTPSICRHTCAYM